MRRLMRPYEAGELRDDFGGYEASMAVAGQRSSRHIVSASARTPYHGRPARVDREQIYIRRMRLPKYGHREADREARLHTGELVKYTMREMALLTALPSASADVAILALTAYDIDRLGVALGSCVLVCEAS